MTAAVMILTNGTEPPSPEELAKPGAVFVTFSIPTGGLDGFRGNAAVSAVLAAGLPVVAMFDDAADAESLRSDIAATGGRA